jgi:hypothetical protein
MLAAIALFTVVITAAVYVTSTVTTIFTVVITAAIYVTSAVTAVLDIAAVSITFAATSVSSTSASDRSPHSDNSVGPWS